MEAASETRGTVRAERRWTVRQAKRVIVNMDGAMKATNTRLVSMGRGDLLAVALRPNAKDIELYDKFIDWAQDQFRYVPAEQGAAFRRCIARLKRTRSSMLRVADIKLGDVVALAVELHRIAPERLAAETRRLRRRLESARARKGSEARR